MSKLDLVTIGIIAICLMAIAFLVYKTTDVFGKKEVEIPEVEIALPEVSEDDDLYEMDSTAISDTITDDVATPSAATTAPATPATTAPSTTPAPSTTTTVRSNDGQYMVMGNTFSYKHSAENEVKMLHSKGYVNAEYALFNSGKFATVIIDRFDSQAAADAFVGQIKSKTNIPAYVQLRRGQ